MKEIGIFEISKILEKSNKSLTGLEKALLRGIHWFATSQTQVEPENELLNLITCLEAFLAPKEPVSITNAIAEGVAFLLADELQIRKYLKKRIKDLYGMRSGISHGGSKAIQDSDLSELRLIAQNLIAIMIKRKEEFQIQEALLAWIEDQKLK